MTKRFNLSVLSNKYFSYLVILPAFILIFGVIVFPIFYSLNLSFKKVNLGPAQPSPFIGLQNYQKAFTRPIFWASVARTFIFASLVVLGAMVIGLCFSLVLNRSFKGRGLVRALILVPWALPHIVTGITWKWIFNANYGVLNGILYSLGLIESYKAWLGSADTALYMIVVPKVWKEIPFVALILLAGLQTIPRRLYESARVDGANPWQSFLHVTLPLLKPQILVVLVLETVWAIRVFDVVYAMTRGGPANASMVLNYLTYKETFEYLHFGYGAALAWIMLIITLGLAIIYVAQLRSEDSVY